MEESDDITGNMVGDSVAQQPPKLCLLHYVSKWEEPSSLSELLMMAALLSSSLNANVSVHVLVDRKRLLFLCRGSLQWSIYLSYTGEGFFKKR